MSSVNDICWPREARGFCMDMRVQALSLTEALELPFPGILEMDVAHLRSLAHAHMPKMTEFIEALRSLKKNLA